MDFSLVLVIAVAVAGAVWLVDLIALRGKRKARLASAEASIEGELDGESRQKLMRDPWPVDYAKSFFPVLLLVLVVRSFAYEPFRFLRARCCRR